LPIRTSWSGTAAVSTLTPMQHVPLCDNRVTFVDVRVGPSLVLVRLRAEGDAEIELWGARRKRELFERVYDRDLELTTQIG